MQKYTLEDLKPLNGVYIAHHRLEQSSADLVNRFAKLLESTRGDEPCPGDIIEYTDDLGNYSHNAHIYRLEETGRFSVSCVPHVPFVYEDDEKGVTFNAGGGPWVSVDPADFVYVGKREKMFMVTDRNCFLPAHSGLYFYAKVNVWEYTAPDQKYPGYSTKTWRKQHISCIENPADDSGYHYFGQNIAFRTDSELQLWKATYKAVEFPGHSPNNTVLFLYRERDRLVSREEWDGLDLPLDTRRVNGIIHVKAACDDGEHLITAYRFTNSGYLDTSRFVEYERAKGTALVAPGPEIKGII